MWKPRDDGSQHAVRFVVASLFSPSPCIPLPLLMISYGIRGNLMSHTHRDADIVPREARKYLSTEKREKIHDAEVTTIKCIFRYRNGRFVKLKKKKTLQQYLSCINIYEYHHHICMKLFSFKKARILRRKDRHCVFDKIGHLGFLCLLYRTRDILIFI